MMNAVLWDMNGVLVDDEPIQEQCWTAALADRGIELPIGWWNRDFLGRKDRATLKHLFPNWTDDEHTQLIAEKSAHYEAAAAHGIPLVPGAIETVWAFAKAGIWQAIVTGASDRERALGLGSSPIAGMMDAIVTGADVTHSKPHPEGFLLGAARLGVPIESCWVIEDAPSGIAAARAAGARAVGITTTQKVSTLSDADIIIDRLSPSLVDRLFPYHTKR